MVTSTAVEAVVEYVSDDAQDIQGSLDSVDAAHVVLGRPVRRIKSHAGQRHYSGLFWSATMDAHLPYESLLELDRLWLADFDVDVSAIASQPITFVSRCGEKPVRHTPDFLLQRSSGRFTVVDVKPEKRQLDPVVQRQFSWTSRLCQFKGWEYEVWGGNDPRLGAVRFLGSCRRRRLIDPDALDSVAEHFEPGMTLGETVVAAAVDEPGDRVRAAVLHLLWRQELKVDELSTLSDASVLLEGVQTG